MDIDALQKLIDPEPPTHREQVARGGFPCDQLLPEELRAPTWLQPQRGRQLAAARALAEQVPSRVTLYEVLGVPVWLSTTEDGEDPDVELVLLLLAVDGDWLAQVALPVQDACWFQGQLRVFGRRLIVPGRSYAPDVPLDGRFGEYGVLSADLGREVASVQAITPVPALLPPRPLAGAWCSGADLAMDPALLPSAWGDRVEACLERLRFTPPDEVEPG